MPSSRFDDSPHGRKILRIAAGGSLLLGTAGAGLVVAPSAGAAAFEVTNLDDAGAGSLRQAILDANASAGADSITFAPDVAGTIVLTSGELPVTGGVTITGPGSSVLAVSGNDNSRIFAIEADDAVVITGLTITDGKIDGDDGAAIYSYGNDLTLSEVVISSSRDTTATAYGGGLYFSGEDADLVLADSVITGNTGVEDGAGIYVTDAASATITGSVFSGNEADDAGGGVYIQSTTALVSDSTIAGNSAFYGGGGYLNPEDGETVTLSRVEISDNTADAGGAIKTYSDGEIEVESSTISGNVAPEDLGGGILLYGSYGGLTVAHSTIAGNVGGGIVSLNAGAQVVLDHALVADNTGSADLVNIDGSSQNQGAGRAGGNQASASSPSALSDFSADWSLVETGTDVITAGADNVLGVDPQLGPLVDGVLPFDDTSPAYNAGDPAFVPPPSTDQRGLPRVQFGRIDIGAFELQPAEEPVVPPEEPVAAEPLVVAPRFTG
jgi:hypothetical protein